MPARHASTPSPGTAPAPVAPGAAGLTRAAAISAPAGEAGNASTGGTERPMNAQLARPVRKQGQGDEITRLPLLDGVQVLVVDDDEDAPEAVTAVLESCGGEGVGAARAGRALQSLPRAPPHGILSGIAMPADGREPPNFFN